MENELQVIIFPLFSQYIVCVISNIPKWLLIFREEKKMKYLGYVLIIVFVFYFQKLVFENIKKNQFSCIFKIKNMFG